MSLAQSLESSLRPIRKLVMQASQRSLGMYSVKARIERLSEPCPCLRLSCR